MIKPTRKRLLLIGVGLVVLVALIWAFRPTPLPVQTAQVTRGPLQVILEEEGETRVQDRYEVSSPVPAYMRRVEVRVGDVVRAGQPLVRLEPPRAAGLDPRARMEAAGRVQAATALVQQAETAAGLASAHHRRIEQLLAAGAVSPQTLEQAAADVTRTSAALSAARAELAVARNALEGTSAVTSAPGQQEALLAPVGGQVLAVHRRSEGHVNPGEPLVEIGSAGHLEVVVDVLSQDAVRIRPGTRTMLEQWGGETPLEAVVRRVGPQGFTTTSALGVEERRVPVVADIVSPPEIWSPALGAGYRILARFVVWEGDDVVQIPTSALFRSESDEWAVFAVEGERAVRRDVRVGQRAGLSAEITAGLRVGETVVTHPASTLEEGARVRPTASFENPG